MIPLTALGKTSYTTGPGSITRFNMYTSAPMQATPAPGYSSGQAMEAITRIGRTPARKHRTGMERTLVPRTEGFGTDRQGDGARANFRLPFPRCTV